MSNHYPTQAASNPGRVLLVSLNFPPSSIASVHRARHLVNWLPASGWSSTVICVDERFHKEPPDIALSGLVRPDVDLVKVPALPPQLTRYIGLGDLALRSMYFLRGELGRQIASVRPDVVFITGWPFYQMLLTRWINRRFGVPVVLDFQDPWVSRQGRMKRFGTKAWLSSILSQSLEPIALRGASFITTVSEKQNDELAERYPWLDRRRMAGIPIGGDPADFDAVRVPLERKVGDREWITLSYVGTALPRSGPLFQALFKGLAILRDQHPELASRLRIRCVGTSNQAADSKTNRVLPLAKAEGVESFMVEEPARVPFLDALQILSSTDAVLMIGSDEVHYTASKIYPGMMSGRPFISLFHSQSSAHQILSEAGGGIALAFNSPGELDGLPRRIAEGLRVLLTDPTSLGKVDSRAYEDFTAKAIAGKFAAIFDVLRVETHKS